MLELVFGYSLTRGSVMEQNKSAETYEFSAHFSDIVGRCNSSPAWLSTMDNMILKHRRYGHPREIISNDRISLWAITPTEAVFTLCKVDIYDTKKFPFCWLAQYLTASQLVVVRSGHQLSSIYQCLSWHT